MWKTDTAPVAFGKYKGKPLAAVPAGYLQWAVTNQIAYDQPLPDTRPVPVIVAFHEAAAAELDRRGERVNECEIAPQAVDRLSTVGLEVYLAERKPAGGGQLEGAHSFLVRGVDNIIRLDERVGMARYEAERTGKPEQVKARYMGLEWVIQVNLAIPVLVTVNPAGGS